MLIPHSTMSRLSSKEIADLNITIEQMEIDIHRTSPPTTAEYTYSLSKHGTFPRVDNTLGIKTSLNKLKKKNSNYTKDLLWLQWSKTTNQ